MSILKETTIARRDRKLCPTINTGKGLTEQSHLEQCDINIILADYSRTGFMRHAKENQGRYDDVTSYDFQKSMETVANVKSMFEGLPSAIRNEFGHDPNNFLNYVQNPQNVNELAKRGILKGNDGIDITGAYNKAPTKADLSASEPSASESVADKPQTSESASE